MYRLLLAAFYLVLTIEPSQVVYLPLVINGKHITIGVETEASMSKVGQWYNPNTALKVSVRGSEVLASPLSYEWSSLDDKLAGYQATWITVKTAPYWMAEGNIICKLPQHQYWYRYAAFVQKVIDRYHPQFIEIWNEPDVRYEDMPEGHERYYGCLGFDGTEYGQFADYIYESVSGAHIIIGATTGPYSGFISDMLEAVGISYSGISFHCYEHFRYFVSDWCTANYEYSARLTDKPRYISETAVIYKEGSMSMFEQGQVAHYRRMRQLPTEWHWYTLANNGWNYTDMVYFGVPRLVHGEYAQD